MGVKGELFCGAQGSDPATGVSAKGPCYTGVSGTNYAAHLRGGCCLANPSNKHFRIMQEVGDNIRIGR